VEPATARELESLQAGAAVERPTLLHGVKILVVDDDVDACSLVQRVLDDCGARVTTAASSAKGIELFEVDRPDVIISDISMPDQDGYRFIHEIRVREAGRRTTPAAALTAFTRPEDRTRALLAGYQAHIPKPLAAEELIAVVASLTGRIPQITDPNAKRETPPHTVQSRRA
jgi:CheY-like chemotaxis protein